MPMMVCGHASNANDRHGNPVCAICAPRDEAYMLAEDLNTSGRIAKCKICGKKTESKTSLAFFKYNVGRFDDYYCGCVGFE